MRLLWIFAYLPYLKKSTVEWNLNYPKHSDLIWRVKAPGEKDYITTEIMPFNMSKEYEYNKKNISTYKAESNLNDFFK